MNNFNKFIVACKDSEIHELDSNDLFLNFYTLDNKYSNLLNYGGNEMILYNDIRESLKDENIKQFNRMYYIAINDEKASSITSSMSLEERKAYLNVVRDYVKLNQARYEKEKSI